MIVRECMTTNVKLANPEMTLKEAAQAMRDGDFGVMPVGDNDRLVGMVTDRDIAIRAIADGRDPERTTLREIMSKGVLYCYDDQTLDEVAHNMGENRVRRLPVLNRQKRLVGILSLGDVATTQQHKEHAKDALSQISKPGGQQQEARM